jgi:hypothetical protein
MTVTLNLSRVKLLDADEKKCCKKLELNQVSNPEIVTELQ